MKIIPISARYLVQFKKEEEKQGFLILPTSAPPQFATVIHLGDDNEMGLDIGDLVLLSKYAGVPVINDGETYLVVEAKDIIAYVEQENE
jgi:co-chaperonin GroES (HSP10)